ncbi:MAG TPA: M28 family metallopeptidase [Gemmatimonadaceae bacterium]|nr:M28 family metallopeptidase [Gemmatimonadaceae bacterium]
MSNARRFFMSVAAAIAVVGCTRPGAVISPAVKQAAQAISADSLLQHIKDLSADSMEGRAPGTKGEEMATSYMQRHFAALGLTPGNPDGSWYQPVELIGYDSRPSVRITAGGKPLALRYLDDFVATSRHDRPETRVNNSGIVFVGYGVVAPEYGWDDYKGVDVKGKTILMLVNDPPVRMPNDTAQLDTTMFKGKAMTYYGRWTYKYEIATAKGAGAAIVIHETGPAGYPWAVVRGSFAGEQFDVSGPSAEQRVPVEGWMTLDKVKELFAHAGLNFDSLHAAARTKDFHPVALNATASWDVKTRVRRITSKNVVAKVVGATKPDEYVIYTAHWDHLGRDTTLKGDQIYNGAADNASGSAGLLEIARAYTRLATPPDRSILFLSVTAEEKGLLGSKYYAEHPLYPLDKTLAEINMDVLNQWGRTSDMTVIGYGNTTLDDIATRILAADGRVVRPDAEPEKGFYYRSDHFEFAKVGVPAFDPEGGIDYIGKPAGYGMQKRDEYTNNDYHKPSDEVKPDWDLSGAVADLQVYFELGHTVANGSTYPTWKPGTEFKAIRDSMMARKM